MVEGGSGIFRALDTTVGHMIDKNYKNSRTLPHEEHPSERYLRR